MAVSLKSNGYQKKPNLQQYMAGEIIFKEKILLTATDTGPNSRATWDLEVYGSHPYTLRKPRLQPRFVVVEL